MACCAPKPASDGCGSNPKDARRAGEGIPPLRRTPRSTRSQESTIRDVSCSNSLLRTPESNGLG